MGWVIMGVVLFVLLNKKGHCGSRRDRRHRRHGPELPRSNPSASEMYRMQAEAEDMKRRMRVMERILDPRDDRLRQDIQNL